MWWVGQHGRLRGRRAPRNLRAGQRWYGKCHTLLWVQDIAIIHWFSLHGCLAGSWQRSVWMLVMMSNHRLWGRMMPWGGRRLLGDARRFEVCDVGRNDLGLPFLNRNQERLHLEGIVEWS